MATTTLNLEGMMLFEQPFAKVPYENYRKVFRTSTRTIEKEFLAVQNASNELVSHSGSREEMLGSLETMIGKVEFLKRKLAELNDSSGTPTQAVLKERLDHLAVAEGMTSSSSPEYARWTDNRLDRWIVDWALRTGREKTARRIAQEKDIKKLVDVDMFTDIRRIEVALAKHSCAEALVWCSENKAALRKLKSTLEFDLRLQEYIELSRSRKKLDAISYMKKYLVSWQDTHMEQIKQALALLVFIPETSCSPYRRLYDSSRWITLVQSFRLAVYSLNTLPTEPMLNLALYAGLASLKLPSCYDHTSKNVDCPVCDPGFGALAEEVPLSHHVNSTIVCQISGKIMNEDDPPMAFPNGFVYSREALEEMAARNQGVVTCPRSGVSCRYENLRKVFVS